MRQARPSPSSCLRLLGEVVEQQPQASSPNIMQADEQVISRAGASSDEVRGSALELSSLRRRGRRATASLAGGEGLEARLERRLAAIMRPLFGSNNSSHKDRR